MSKSNKYLVMCLISFVMVAFANHVHKVNQRQLQADAHAKKVCAGVQLPTAYFCYAGAYQKEVKRLNQ
jgi:hypothetical protein